MRILLIVNSFASSVTARSRVVIQKALAADHEVATVETSRRGHATRFAQDAAARGLDLVVVLGGDGTLNEAANGLAGTSTALAPLPGGSTNVFARTIGMPNDPVEATAVLVDALGRGSIRRVGLGVVNGRYFLFHTGIGFDAAVVREVERRGSLKRWAGHPLFVYAALVTWANRYDRKHERFRLTLADGTVVDQGRFAVVMNTTPYTFLGNRPLHLAPEAGLDHALAVVTFRSMSLPVMARGLTRVLRGAGVPGGKAFDRRRELTAFTVTADPAVPFQVDGDDLGDAVRLEFRYEPDALALVIPPTTPDGSGR